jgi:hypothetical protein
MFKSAAEKAEAHERKAEARATATARKEQERFLRSPIGMAAQAHARGDNLFQIAFAVENDGGKVLSDIEAIGWQLDNASYVFELSLNSMSNVNDQVSGVSSTGEIKGVYLFRRV